MWSNDPPDESFGRLLESVFHTFEAYVVRFPNPYRGEETSTTVYIARQGDGVVRVPYRYTAPAQDNCHDTTA